LGASLLATGYFGEFIFPPVDELIISGSLLGIGLLILQAACFLDSTYPSREPKNKLGNSMAILILIGGLLISVILGVVFKIYNKNECYFYFYIRRRIE